MIPWNLGTGDPSHSHFYFMKFSHFTLFLYTTERVIGFPASEWVFSRALHSTFQYFYGIFPAEISPVDHSCDFFGSHTHPYFPVEIPMSHRKPSHPSYRTRTVPWTFGAVSYKTKQRVQRLCADITITHGPVRSTRTPLALHRKLELPSRAERLDSFFRMANSESSKEESNKLCFNASNRTTCLTYMCVRWVYRWRRLDPQQEAAGEVIALWFRNQKSGLCGDSTERSLTAGTRQGVGNHTLLRTLPPGVTYFVEAQGI